MTVDTIADGPGRRYRRRLAADLLAIPGSGAGTGVVDIGAGAGDLALLLRRRHPSSRLLGLEPRADAVAAARRLVPDAHFRQDDLVGGAPPPTDLYAWATHAVCCEVLGQVDEPAKLLWNARAYLAPGCRLVVTVATGPAGPTGLTGPTGPAGPGRGAAGPVGAAGDDVADRPLRTAADLHRLLEQAGLDVDLVTGYGVPFFNLYRAAELVRGRELVDADVTSTAGRLAVRAGEALLRFDRARSRFGWQLVAVAREPL